MERAPRSIDVYNGTTVLLVAVAFVAMAAYQYWCGRKIEWTDLWSAVSNGARSAAHVAGGALVFYLLRTAQVAFGWAQTHMPLAAAVFQLSREIFENSDAALAKYGGQIADGILTSVVESVLVLIGYRVAHWLSTLAPAAAVEPLYSGNAHSPPIHAPKQRRHAHSNSHSRPQPHDFRPHDSRPPYDSRPPDTRL